jgi:hypothetical protein
MPILAAIKRCDVNKPPVKERGRVMMPVEVEPIVYILYAILFAFFVILVLIGISIKLSAFFRQLAFIYHEIRSTTGDEQRYWMQEKRRLWQSLIPFYRR